MSRKPYPDNIPETVKNALDAFTDEELESLTWTIIIETNEFGGIGFFGGPEGKFTQFANPEKANAIAILEEQLKKELRERGDRIFIR